MNFLEGTKVAWSSIKGNKLRSLLTILGIIIGVGAVITLVSVGQGASKNISDNIAGMGSNLITINPLRGTSLGLADADELLERVPTITDVLPSMTFSTTARWTNQTYRTTVEGVNHSYPVVRDTKTLSGRFFTEEEVKNRERVALIGQTVRNELLGNISPLGEQIRINGQLFSIIGVLEPKGSTMGRDNDDTILIPITVAQRLTGSTNLGTIYARAESPEVSMLAVTHITAIFDHKFKRENSVRVTSQDQLLETIDSTTKTFALMLGAIAGISLLVGGIGIMNIMLVSVTERTREIGIRKALGAKRKDIMSQFIVESVFISLAGGLVGIVMGAAASQLIAELAGWATIISTSSIMISFFFALAIGLFFGVYPAYKAANLDPIVALRHE